MASPTPAFYAALQALGCVPCPQCDGSYMFPDHVTHRPLCDGPSTPPDVQEWEAAALARLTEAEAIVEEEDKEDEEDGEDEDAEAEAPEAAS
jgi:endogenous inhibitor of DNA gyrase (YacG/DUF329 family)